MEKNLFAAKVKLLDIFKFLDVNDYFNLELSNKNIRTQLLTYYKMKTKNLQSNIKITEKNIKKLFLSQYLNSFVVFNVQLEFNSLEQIEINLKNDSNISVAKTPEIKKIEEFSTLIENTHTCCNSIENSLFNQE